MSRRRSYAMLLAICCATLASGCASNGTSGNVQGSVYYGAGWHDPYYYGQSWNDAVVVVPNPPGRPDQPARPEQPAQLPAAAQPRPAQLPSARPASRPSIPSAPRPRAGGRRR